MTTPKQIAHDAHREHPLVLGNTAGSGFFISGFFRCDGCGCDGFGLRYRCAKCDFDLHEHCATCPATASVPFHAQHAVEFEAEAPVFPANQRSCDLCGPCVRGMHYACRPCGFAVHPVCSQLPVAAVSPLHPVHLVTLTTAVPRKCTHCGVDCLLWRYRCVPCGIDLHPRCLLGSSHQTPLRIPRG